MAFTVDDVRTVVERYLIELEKNNIRVLQAFVFGSYARGTADEDSDIDLAIISKDFAGTRFLDRRRIVPLRRRIDERIEPMPFLPENFADGDPLALQIRAEGIEVELPYKA